MPTALHLLLGGVGSASCGPGPVRGGVRGGVGGAQCAVGVQQVGGLALHFGVLPSAPLEALDETGLYASEHKVVTWHKYAVQYRTSGKEAYRFQEVVSLHC